MRLNPNYPLARFHLAEAYRGKGQFDQARDSYKQFLDVWHDADADIPEVSAAGKLIGKL